MNKNAQKDVEDKEIDLSTISLNVGNAMQNLNSFIFSCIQFVLRNIIIITILILVGVGLGLYLDKTQKTYDHQIIVAPNFGSVDYLYGKIDLINSKIRERDTVFLRSIGIHNASKLSRIEIQPIVDVYKFVNNNEMNFQVLKLMADEGDVKKIVEERPTSKNYTYHLISFSTRHATNNKSTVEPLMAYLNNSDFFRQIQKVTVNNILEKIRANDIIIGQIDGILNEFANNAGGSSSSSVYISENAQLNDVIKTKDDLLEEQGYHRLTLTSYDKIIKNVSTITNIENTKSLNGKLKLLLPLILLSIFILIHLFRSFYRNETLKRQLT